MRTASVTNSSISRRLRRRANCSCAGALPMGGKTCSTDSAPRGACRLLLFGRTGFQPHDPRQQPLAHLVPHLLAAGILAEIVELLRVAGEVEQLRLEVLPMHVLPAVGAHHPRATGVGCAGEQKTRLPVTIVK